MVLPDSVKSHPVISVFAVLVVAGVIGFAAYSYTQGTGFVDDQGCAWSPLQKPSGANFTSTEEVEDFFQQNDEEIPNELRLQEKDGVVYHNIPGECGTVGGETS